jgi:hypothetical protein
MRILWWLADLLNGLCRSITAPMPTQTYSRLRYLPRMGARPHSSGLFDLSRSSAEFAVAARGGSFGRGGYTAADFSMFGGDPTLRLQEAFEQRRGQAVQRFPPRQGLGLAENLRLSFFLAGALIGLQAY